MTAPAYPNLHRIAYGEGARLTAEARVEAADALERLARTCETCNLASPTVRADELLCCRSSMFERPTHSCADWQPQPLTPAHDKEKS